MNAIAQYWNMWCISLSNERLRYRQQAIPAAQTFCEMQLEDTQPDSKQTTRRFQSNLFSQFRLQAEPKTDTQRIIQSAQAGLCLRCYVSNPILRACQKIDSLFSGNKAFSYQDLLPFVLNDDGKKLVLVDTEDQAQLVLDNGQIKPSAFKLFSVEVLKTYQDHASSSMSLENWTFLRTKQQPELKTFLSEFGFQPFSDWTLLNRIQVNQRDRLSARDQQIVDVFHQVYRRDRRKQGKFNRCANPNDAQLAEMNGLLAKTRADFKDPQELLGALKQVAKQLRAFDIWQAREPLEIKDIDTGDYTLRRDLPAVTLHEEALEEQDFITFLSQQGALSLANAIAQAVQDRLAKLKKSKRYLPFASCYVPGLLRYYQEGISLKEIGAQLGMNNWDQTRRILNPGELLSQVRSLVNRQLLALTLEKAQTKGLIATPPEPDKFKQLMEEMEFFLDDKYFAAAAAELKAGKNRALESDYAQRLIDYLSACG